MKFKPRFRDDNVKFKAKFATTDSVINALEVTENGVWHAPNGVDGFNPVKVNVPIPDGFIKPEGTIDITQDGEFDVRNFEKANVNASGAVGNLLNSVMEGTATEISYDKCTKLASYLFYAKTDLVSVDFPNVKEIGSNTFRSCSKLKNVNIPNVEKISGAAFEYCYLETADFPKVTDLGSNCFYQNTGLSSINMPNVVNMGDATFLKTKLSEINFPNLKKAGSNCFSGITSATTAFLPLLTTIPQTFLDGCNLLKSASFGRPTSVGAASFRSNYSLTSIVLRSRSVCSLGNVSALGSAYHYHGTVNATYNPEGLKDGYIYVPRDLIDSYKVATNWSTFADQFRAIEDYPEIEAKDNYSFSILSPSSSGYGNYTSTIRCNIGDLIIASLVVDTTGIATIEGWNFISQSPMVIGGSQRLEWLYKYAESEEESITVRTRSINLFAFKGATGFVDNGYVKKNSETNVVTVDSKPEGLVLWAATSSSAGSGYTWEIGIGEPIFQPTSTFKYLMNVLDQSDFETFTIKLPQASNYRGECIVGSLTIEGIDKFETWR